jgi:hypothetical protein
MPGGAKGAAAAGKERRQRAPRILPGEDGATDGVRQAGAA